MERVRSLCHLKASLDFSAESGEKFGQLLLLCMMLKVCKNSTRVISLPISVSRTVPRFVCSNAQPSPELRRPPCTTWYDRFPKVR